jgi:hypothetical protein
MSDLDFQPHSFTFDICRSDMTSIFMTARGMRGIYSSRDEYKGGGGGAIELIKLLLQYVRETE